MVLSALKFCKLVRSILKENKYTKFKFTSDDKEYMLADIPNAAIERYSKEHHGRFVVHIKCHDITAKRSERTQDLQLLFEQKITVEIIN